MRLFHFCSTGFSEKVVRWWKAERYWQTRPANVIPITTAA
jgi:hypothetical protein